MANLNDPTAAQAVAKFLYPQSDGDSITWAGYIRTGAENDTSGEDVLSVLNEKVGEAQLIGHGTADPTNTPGVNEPWIYIDTSSDKAWFKKRSGSAGSYTYAWAGPFHEGNSRTEVIYNTANARPNDPAISWNWETDAFGVTRNGWTSNSVNARWAMIVTLPRNTNNGFASPAFRVVDPTAEEISYTPPAGDGNIPSSVSNVKEGLDAFHTANIGSGGNVNQMPADWDATTGVTRILNKPDIPPFYEEEFPHTSNLLRGVNSTQDQAFTIPTDLQTFRSRYGQPLFIEGNVSVEIQPSVGASDSVTFVLEVVTSSGNALNPTVISDPVTLTNAAGRDTETARVIGILPENFSGGLLRCRVTAASATTPVAGVEHFRVKVDPSLGADDIVVKNDDLGNNLTSTGLTTVEDAISQMDELPIFIGSDFEDVNWPTGTSSIDSSDGEVRRTVTIHENIRNAITRDVHYIVQVRFKVKYEGGSTDGRTDVDVDFKIYTNLSGNAILTDTSIRNQGPTAVEYTYEVSLPFTTVAPSTIIFGIEAPSGQFDARAEVTDFQARIRDGIDASGFTTDGRILDNGAVSYQEAFKQVYDYIIANAPVDASSWGTNLPSTSPATIQGTFNHINSLAITQNASQVPVTSSQFSDPNNFIGGLREVTGLNPNPRDNPTNVQQALVKADYLLQAAYNPYQSTQELDRSVGGGFSGTFSSNTTGYILSNDIDIPEEVRDLGVPGAVRFRARLQSITSGYAGDIRLVGSDYNPSASPPNTVTYGDPEVINTTSRTSGQYISFQRRLANPLPDTFKVRFRRSSASGTAVFDDGFVDVVDTTGTVMGGAGGQSSSYSTTIIWLAGAGINDRIDTASEVTNYTLMSGHMFSAYDQLAFVFDGGAGSTQPLIACWVDSNLFQAFGATGTLWIVGNWWLMVSRQSDNTFRWRWRAPSNGLRRIIGIRTN